MGASPVTTVDLLGLDAITDAAVQQLGKAASSKIRSGTIATILAQACIARNCIRGGTARNFIDAYGDCLSEYDRFEKAAPGLAAAISAVTRSSEGPLGGCAEQCSRETNSPTFKTRCSRACVDGGGAGGFL